MQDDATDVEGNMTTAGKLKPIQYHAQKDKIKLKYEVGLSRLITDSQDAKIEEISSIIKVCQIS